MPMPYTLTKGPLFTTMETALNDPTRRANAFASLQSGIPLAEMPWVTTGGGQTVAIPGQLQARLYEDWFGYEQQNANWIPQSAFTGQSTGYWVGYYGNTEAVLREGLIRTIEVALGLDHADEHGTVPSELPREWPIEVAWKCPNPYFEVWITWQKHGSGPGDGHVTMLVCTPPDTNNRIVTRPKYPPHQPGQVPVPPLDTPQRADDDEGMWLVAYEEHVQKTVDPVFGYRDVEDSDNDDDGPAIVDVIVNGIAALAGLAKNNWAVPVPSTFWVDSNDSEDVVVVAPPAYAGGV